MNVPLIFYFCTGLKTLLHVPYHLAVIPMAPILKQIICVQILSFRLPVALIMNPPERVRTMFDCRSGLTLFANINVQHSICFDYFASINICLISSSDWHKMGTGSRS